MVPRKTPEQLLTNGEFGSPPSSRGFDWRVAPVEGVSVSQEEHGLRVTFSGHEPEECEALAQLVPLKENTRYELKFGYRTSGLGTGQGLGWRVTDENSGSVLSEGSVLASEADQEGRLNFETPRECRLVRVALRYQRSPGTTRIEGFLTLRSVQLKAAVQSPIVGTLVRK